MILQMGFPNLILPGLRGADTPEQQPKMPTPVNINTATSEKARTHTPTGGDINPAQV